MYGSHGPVPSDYPEDTEALLSELAQHDNELSTIQSGTETALRRNQGAPSSSSRSRRTNTAVLLAVILALLGSVVLLNRGFMGQNSTQGWTYFPVAKEGSSAQQGLAGQGKTTSKVATTLMSAAPTFAPTYLTTMLYVIQVISFFSRHSITFDRITMACRGTDTPTYPTPPPLRLQRIDDITLEQSLDSKFESSFVTGVISGSSVHMTLVKYVESKSALYGAGVDCEYFVEAKGTNAEELTAVVRSGSVTDTLVATLQA